MNDVRAFLSFFCPFRLLFGEPRVSSGRFLASFPFEPASNLTPAFPAVFPGFRRRLAFPYLCLFAFRVLFTLPFPFIFPYRLLFGEPRVFSAPLSETRRSRPERFLVSFPFEAASNLTPAFPGCVSRVSSRRLPSRFPLSSFRVLFAPSFRSLFPFPVPVLFVPFCFLFVSFRSFSRPLCSLSRPLCSLVFLFESSSKGRRSRRPGFCRVCQCFVNKTQQRRFRLHFSFSFAVCPFPVLFVRYVSFSRPLRSLLFLFPSSSFATLPFPVGKALPLPAAPDTQAQKTHNATIPQKPSQMHPAQA